MYLSGGFVFGLLVAVLGFDAASPQRSLKQLRVPNDPCRECVASWSPTTLDFNLTLCNARAFLSSTNGLCRCDRVTRPSYCTVPDSNQLCTGSVFLQCNTTNCLGGFASVGGVVFVLIPCNQTTGIGRQRCGDTPISVLITVVDIVGQMQSLSSTFTCPSCNGAECE
jgi:hypothetical protein